MKTKLLYAVLAGLVLGWLTPGCDKKSAPEPAEKPAWMEPYQLDRIVALAERHGFEYLSYPESELRRMKEAGCGGFHATFTTRVERGDVVQEGSVYASAVYCPSPEILDHHFVSSTSSEDQMIRKGAAAVGMRFKKIDDPELREELWKGWASGEPVGKASPEEEIERLAKKLCLAFKVAVGGDGDRRTLSFVRSLNNELRDPEEVARWSEPRKRGDEIIRSYRRCMPKLVDAAKPYGLVAVEARVMLGADVILHMDLAPPATDPRVLVDTFDELEVEKQLR
jgi:hypothetical protein